MSLSESQLKKFAENLPGIDGKQFSEDIRKTKGNLKRLEHLTSIRVHEHPDWSRLAARILHHRIVDQCQCGTFGELVEKMKSSGKAHPVFLENYTRVADKVEAWMDHGRDDLFEYFAMRVLYDKYLIRYPTHEDPVWERPQFLYMRVAIAIYGHFEDVEIVREAYDHLSLLKFTHATPALMNAGWNPSQYSSCFLYGVPDSIRGIYSALKKGALLSKSGGGCGASMTAVRSTGSIIYGTGGVSTGLQPVMAQYEKMYSYVNQGGGKRKGGFAAYLEPWHADIEDFLACKAASRETHQLNFRDSPHFNIALWVPDLFMRRVQEGGVWSLFDSGRFPKLMDTWGEKFEQLYERLERKGEYVRQVSAVGLWERILQTQIESGVPYILFKDACNRKSNQQYLGTIRNSNLCAEVVLYQDEKHIAVCNLASMCLSQFVTSETCFDFGAFRKAVYLAIRGLNRVIDINYYPVEATKRSNLKWRPVGLGVQGLADVFAKMHLPFESAEARKLNRRIAEHMYYAAVNSSIDEAERVHAQYVDAYGQWNVRALNQLKDREKNRDYWPVHNLGEDTRYAGAYEGFAESPAGKGKLQPQLWGIDIVHTSEEKDLDWARTFKRLRQYGMRNSQLVMKMPTASTSNLCGNYECFEPINYQHMVRNVSNGRFFIINPYLVRELEALGLWDARMRDDLLRGHGSVQHIERIPEKVRARYKTAYEMSQRTLIDMSADCGPFTDGSHSRNLYLKGPVDPSVLHSCLMYSWSRGEKTGSYYVRTDLSVKPIEFGLSQKDHQEAPESCSTTGVCESCSG